MADEEISQVGRFRIERVLGQGAMGKVYLAHDPEIERLVAIKLVRVDGEAFQEHRAELEARFLKEAKMAGRLQHANIVTIYDVGRDTESFFIAMEFVEGKPLSKLLKDRSLTSDAQRFSLIRQVASALGHAHEKGVLHRDVKPANILIRTDGTVKVSDFGIGKLLTGDSDLTRTGQMVGSPSYMSPEQIKGEKLDARADLFSLGVVSYEILTGSRPFPGDTITQLVYQILHSEPKDPLELRPDLPPGAREFLRRAIAKKRDDRFADAREFLTEMDRVAVPRVDDTTETYALASHPAGDTPVGVPRPASDSHPSAGVTSTSTPTIIVERRGGGMILGGAALVLAAAALLFVVMRSKDQPLVVPVTTGSKARVASSSAALSTSGTTSSPTTAGAASSTSAPATTAAPASGIAPAAKGAASSSQPGRGPDERGTSQKKTPSKPSDSDKAARASSSPATAAAVPASHTAPVAVPAAPAGLADNSYTVKSGVRFRITPDQARIYVDGKYIGIADDWDNRGGGKILPLAPGTHRVRATLPGYRDLNLQIVVSSTAKEDVVSPEDELKKIGNGDFEKLHRPDYDTQGKMMFISALANAVVTVDGKAMGKGGDYSPVHPLILPGPMVHDVVLSETGKASKSLRVIVASTTDRELAVIEEKLK